MLKRIKPSLVISILLAGAAVAWILSGQGGAPDIVGMEPEPVAIRELPSVRTTESVAVNHRAVLLYTGRTQMDRRTVLRAETEGRIIEIGAEISDPIAEGALVVKLAANDRFAKLAEAEALLRQRDTEYKAAQQLAGKGFQTESARAAAEANLSSARAALETIRTDIAHTTIKAPFDGIVESRIVEIGDYVQGGDEVARIVDFDPIIIAIQVSEREIHRIDPGTVAPVELISGVTRDGVVSRISTTANNTTRTFEVELEVENQDGRLRDGMTAKVNLPTQEVMAHKISPAWLTLADSGSVGLKSVDADDRVVFHPITLVEDTADGMWVSGLPDRVSLITVGHVFVAPGIKVKATPDNEITPSTPTEALPDSGLPAVSVGETLGERS